MFIACLIHEFMPPEISSAPHIDLCSCSFQDDHFFDGRAAGRVASFSGADFSPPGRTKVRPTWGSPTGRFTAQSTVDILFQFDHTAPPEGAVGSDDHFCFGIV